MAEILSTTQGYQYRILERERFNDSKKLSRVLVEISHPKKQAIITSRLVSKFPNCYPRPGLGESQTDLYCEKITGLASAGIPVVPRVYVVSDTEVLLPDLTLDGGIILDKHANDLSPDIVNDEITQLVRGFALLDAIMQLSQIVDLANMHDIGLPFDDPLALYIGPDSEIQALVLDVDPTNLKGTDDDVTKNRVTSLIFFGLLKHLKERFS